MKNGLKQILITLYQLTAKKSNWFYSFKHEKSQKNRINYVRTN